MSHATGSGLDLDHVSALYANAAVPEFLDAVQQRLASAGPGFRLIQRELGDLLFPAPFSSPGTNVTSTDVAISTGPVSLPASFILDCITTIWTGSSQLHTAPAQLEIGALAVPIRTWSAAVAHLLLDCIPADTPGDALRDVRGPAAALFQKCCTPVDIRLACKLAVAYKLQASDVAALQLPGELPSGMSCTTAQTNQGAGALAADTADVNAGLAKLAQLVTQLISDKATQASAVGLMMHFPVSVAMQRSGLNFSADVALLCLRFTFDSPPLVTGTN